MIPREVVESIVNKEFSKVSVGQGPDTVVIENLKNKVMNMSKEQLSQDDDNGFMISVKGSLFNVCQMTEMVRQQYINGKRLTEGGPKIFDQGSVVGSFELRISPDEFFSHARAGRTSLCDTALITSQTEYSQGKLIRLMEKMVINNDESFKCVYSKNIYEGVLVRTG